MCLYVFCGSLFIVFIRYTYVEWSVGVGFPIEKNAMRRKKSRMISCFNGYDLSKCGWALPYSAYNSHRSCAFCWTSATVIRLSRHTGQRLYLHNTNFKMFTNIDMYLITIVVRLNEMLLVLFVGHMEWAPPNVEKYECRICMKHYMCMYECYMKNSHHHFHHIRSYT